MFKPWIPSGCPTEDPLPDDLLWSEILNTFVHKFNTCLDTSVEQVSSRNDLRLHPEKSQGLCGEDNDQRTKIKDQVQLDEKSLATADRFTTTLDEVVERSRIPIVQMKEFIKFVEVTNRALIYRTTALAALACML